MSNALETLRTGAHLDRQSPRLLEIFAAWPLQAYGCALAVVPAVLLVHLYKVGWLVDSARTPALNDFTAFWIAEAQTLHGEDSLVIRPGPNRGYSDRRSGTGSPHFYLIWPYPPIFFS